MRYNTFKGDNLQEVVFMFDHNKYSQHRDHIKRSIYKQYIEIFPSKWDF